VFVFSSCYINFLLQFCLVDKLQRVLNAAARVVTGTLKFDGGLGQILHDQLHWLDVPDRVLFKLALTVHQCLKAAHHRICRSTASRSPVLTRGGICILQLSPTCRTAFPAQHLRPFSFAGPMAWNSLPDFIRDPTSSTDCFRHLLKTYLFTCY